MGHSGGSLEEQAVEGNTERVSLAHEISARTDSGLEAIHGIF